MFKKLLFSTLKLVALCSLCIQVAMATPILVRTGTTASGEGGYGDAGWSALTGLLDTASGNMVTTTGNFTDNTAVQNAGALWINTGSLNGSTNLSGAELANVSQFILTGKRVVMFGENSSWTSWNNNILSLVGSSQGGGASGVATTTLAHPLTAGVSSIQIISGAAAAGGTSLFSQNVASLWGAGNVLTYLDSNTLQNAYLSSADNLIFGQNLTNWISGGGGGPAPEPVPAPATLALFGLGLAGLGWSRRKKA